MITRTGDRFSLFSAVIFYGENAICVLYSTWLCLIKVLSTEFPSTPEYFSKVLSTGPPLGGERSILLSYRDIYSIFGLFPGFLELQPVLRRLRRAVLLIKKRSIFDRFISSLLDIEPAADIRREVGTVASGVNSQDE